MYASSDVKQIFNITHSLFIVLIFHFTMDFEILMQQQMYRGHPVLYIRKMLRLIMYQTE